jgi:hypothetical protein
MLRFAVAAFALLAALALVLPADAKVAPPGPPSLPCQNGIAGADCAVGALGCTVRAGYRTGSEHYEYASAYCGPELFAPCTLAYVDTNGNVYSCLVA